MRRFKNGLALTAVATAMAFASAYSFSGEKCAQKKVTQ